MFCCFSVGLPATSHDLTTSKWRFYNLSNAAKFDDSHAQVDSEIVNNQQFKIKTRFQYPPVGGAAFRPQVSVPRTVAEICTADCSNQGGQCCEKKCVLWGFQTVETSWLRPTVLFSNQLFETLGKTFNYCLYF